MVFNFLKNALTRSRKALGEGLSKLFGRGPSEESFDKLEQLLYEADLGVELAAKLSERMRKEWNASLKESDLLALLEKFLLEELATVEAPPLNYPMVVSLVGVNGSGKTTSLAKLAHHFHTEKKKVLIGAADTFRAAAVEQLGLWVDKMQGVDIVRGQFKADPAAVAFDTAMAGKARGAEVVFVDTAGRLQTKTDLMRELGKIHRSAQKGWPEATQETWLVIDATIGQNGLDQAHTFSKYLPLTGLVLTKLDGTAKGGIACAIAREFRLPIRFVGTGEGMEDLSPFDVREYVKALLH